LWSTKTSFAEEARMRESVCPPRRMRYSLESRCRIVGLIVAGESPRAAAAACGASRATGYRLWRRYLEGGWAALVDRPSTPKRQPRKCSRELEQRILAAREYAKAGPVIVAGQLGLPASTVWKVLRRYGVSRLRLPAREPVTRYERSGPGELVHVDIKKLGRFWTIGKRIYGDRLQRNRRAGWQYLHLAIDDHSRLAYAELPASESPADCVAFLHRAVAWYAERGVTVERVLSDNGNG
jgi:transposase